MVQGVVVELSGANTFTVDVGCGECAEGDAGYYPCSGGDGVVYMSEEEGPEGEEACGCHWSVCDCSIYFDKVGTKVILKL